MAEKTIVVDIDIKAEDIRAASAAMAEAQKQSAAYTQALNDLKTQQKEANALYKEGAIDAAENAKRQAALKIQMTEVSKSLSQSNKEYASNKTVVDAANGSNEQLRARLSLLTKEYNGLSKEQRENSKEGKQMQATIKAISDKLKENEKALGDNRRNVGNYGEAIEEALGATTAFGSGLGGMVGGLKAATSASLTFLATPIGAAIGALALAVGAVTGLFSLFSKSLNRTEDGAATLSKVTGTFSAIMNGVLKVLEPLATSVMEGVANGFDKIGKAAKSASGFIEDGLRFFGLDGAADGVNNFSSAIEESVKETRELADAQVELNKINREFQKIQLDYQNRAEKLRQIRDDEALSIEERKKANVELGDVLEEQSQKELKLANRSLEIAKKQAQINGQSTENLDAIAEAETKILEIEERITSQRSEQLTNTNSLIRDQRALLKEAATEKAKQTQEEKKREEERLKAIEQGYIDERALIDQMAETKKNQAIANIANAEEQAETIRYIEKQALLDKIAVIDEETIAATAGADAIGAADQEKYAKQLAERAKYEAQIAMMDRAALAKSFTDKIAAISIDEKLELDAAELSIDNEKKLTEEKAKISIKYLETKLALMTSIAGADGIITDEELKNLKLVENEIAKINGLLVKNEEGSGTLADMLGITDEQLTKIQTNLAAVNQALQAVQSLVSANAQARIQEIETQNQYEVQAVENSALSEEAKAEKIKQINRKAAEEKYKIEVEQFKVGKALSIALAIANTATAVVAQLSNPTPYAGFVLAALAAATGVVQIAAISAQKPPPPPQFASGGYVSGPGTGTSDSIDAKLSNGESVINAKSTAKYGPLLSAINADGGGVDWYRGKGVSGGFFGNAFAGGGIASPTFAARQATNSNTQGLEARIDQLGDRIEQMQPIVRVTDINRVNRQTVKVQQSADL